MWLLLINPQRVINKYTNASYQSHLQIKFRIQTHFINVTTVMSQLMQDDDE